MALTGQSTPNRVLLRVLLQEGEAIQLDKPEPEFRGLSDAVALTIDVDSLSVLEDLF
jgi:hypothetical protein